MLCPRCYGSHVILINGLRMPCPECQGMGEIHCCDGLQEQSAEGCALWAGGAAAPPDDGPSNPDRPDAAL